MSHKPNLDLDDDGLMSSSSLLTETWVELDAVDEYPFHIDLVDGSSIKIPNREIHELIEEYRCIPEALVGETDDETRDANVDSDDSNSEVQTVASPYSDEES